jgi:hypothetical protein
MRSPLGLTCFPNKVHVLAFTFVGSCQTTQGSGLSIIHVSSETSERHAIISPPQCRPFWQDSKSTQCATVIVFLAVSLSVINTRCGIVCYSSSNAGQKKKSSSCFLSSMSMRPTKKLRTWSRAKGATVNFTYRPSCSLNMENVV